MIKRFNSGKGDHWESEDGHLVLHSDHLRAMSALEEENKRLREELKLWKSEVPHASCLHAVATLAAHGDEHGKYAYTATWLRSIAAKGEG